MVLIANSVIIQLVQPSLIVSSPYSKTSTISVSNLSLVKFMRRHILFICIYACVTSYCCGLKIKKQTPILMLKLLFIASQRSSRGKETIVSMCFLFPRQFCVTHSSRGHNRVLSIGSPRRGVLSCISSYRVFGVPYRQNEKHMWPTCYWNSPLRSLNPEMYMPKINAQFFGHSD